ncbi:meteorin-like protein isoform X2 [Saccoglossus kowalevskii]|uniref:Meteorin protein-like 245 n=1 Tax=Saccoglossus kowalevskii TaxID=10224 RepID=A0A0U2UAF5_SACKO|nr:PREDICTED: meteorin-like protein-like isoform X1 [Saccoglossus kowalevskii]ALR88559.1 meteorin protein-like 245 [Saccoglossus kowalevskii]
MNDGVALLLRVTMPSVRTQAVLLWCLVSCVVWVHCHYTSDECDWIGSGLSEDPDNKSVQQLYLGCSKGRVDWDYAYGAIRITFQYGNSGKDFQGCIKPSSKFTGANIYVEGRTKLEYLIHPKLQDKDHNNAEDEGLWKELLSRTHCFESRDGRATLFAEAMPNMDGKRKTVSFEYDLKVNHHQQGKSRDTFEDCRPCNETELMTAFCASDFVVKSKIKEVSDDLSEKETRIELSIGTIYSQIEGVFTNTKHGRHTGTVSMPLQCGVKHGSGHFLMTGSVRLGKNHLTCAPRFSEFRKIAKEMTEKGLNECDMSDVINSPEN